MESPEIVKPEATATADNSHFKPVDNRIVWMLAFAPVIGAVLELTLFVLFGVRFAFATILLNIGLSWIDLDRLGFTAVDTSRLRGWMLFFVPVYLFRREQLTGTRGYFATWMVCFVLYVIAGAALDLGVPVHRGDQVTESQSQISQPMESPPPVAAKEATEKVTPTQSGPASNSQPLDEAQLLDAQLASLNEQLKVAGQKCISTHDADDCDEVQMLKSQRDGILESPEYKLELLRKMTAAQDKREAFDASPEGKAKRKAEAHHRYQEVYRICEGSTPEPKGDDGIVTYQRSIACNDRDGLEQEYPDFKEQGQSHSGGQETSAVASPSTGNNGSPEHPAAV